MKNKNGITLIALIITIIVLIILAGVSISALVGDNGIVSTAMGAKEKNENEYAKEMLEMAWSARLSRYYEEVSTGKANAFISYFTVDELNKELGANGKISSIEKNGGDTYSIVYTDNRGNNYLFSIESSGKANLIDSHIDIEETVITKKDLYGRNIQTGVSSSEIQDNWQVFYIDDTDVYLIYGDYKLGFYPGSGIIVSRTTGIGTVSCSDDSNDLDDPDNLLLDSGVGDDYFTNSSNWTEISNLLTGTNSIFINKSLIAMGAPTKAMYNASKNETNNNINNLYYNSEPLLFQAGEIELESRYYLADVSTEDEGRFLRVNNNGEIETDSDGSFVRPVVKLSITDFQSATGITWR